MIKFSLLYLLALLVLVGCSLSPQQSEQVIYQCGTQPVALQSQTDGVVLSLRGEQQQLSSTRAASGARYQSSDQRTEYWNKGHQATITWKGELLPACVEQGYLPQNIALRGNEPFWLMTLNQDHATYTTPDQEQEFALTGMDDYSDSGVWSLAIEQEDNAIGTIHISDNRCTDSMSGKAHPYSVTLRMAGKELKGCGGETEQLLQGQPWQLNAMTGYSETLLSNLSLQFLPNGRLAGSDGCNRFFGHYSVDGEMPRLNVNGMTKRMCRDDINDVAQKFTQLLNNTAKIAIKENGIVLRVNSGQQLTFAPTY